MARSYEHMGRKHGLLPGENPDAAGSMVTDDLVRFRSPVNDDPNKPNGPFYKKGSEHLLEDPTSSVVGSQGMFFGREVGSMSRHDPSEINRTIRYRAGRNLIDTYGQADNSEPSRVAGEIYRSAIPYRDLRSMNESGLNIEIGQEEDNPTGYSAFYSPINHSVHLFEDSYDAYTISHELAHGLHYGTSKKPGEWLSYSNTNDVHGVDAVDEGVADGYMDRYSTGLGDWAGRKKTFDPIDQNDPITTYPEHFGVSKDQVLPGSSLSAYYAATRSIVRETGEVPYYKNYRGWSEDFHGSPHLQSDQFKELRESAKADRESRLLNQGEQLKLF